MFYIMVRDNNAHQNFWKQNAQFTRNLGEAVTFETKDAAKAKIMELRNQYDTVSEFFRASAIDDDAVDLT